MDRTERAARDAEVLLSWHRWLVENDHLNEFGDLKEHIARKIRLCREHAQMGAMSGGR